MTLAWGRREAATRAAEDATVHASYHQYATMKRTRAGRRKAMGYSRAVADHWIAAAKENAKQEEINDEA